MEEQQLIIVIIGAFKLDGMFPSGGRTYLLLCSLFAYYMLCILRVKTLAYFSLHNKDIHSLIMEVALPDRR